MIFFKIQKFWEPWENNGAKYKRKIKQWFGKSNPSWIQKCIEVLYFLKSKLMLFRSEQGTLSQKICPGCQGFFVYILITILQIKI